MLLLHAYPALAQDVSATIRLRESDPSIAEVDGQFTTGTSHRELRFLASYANISGLDQRIRDVQVYSGEGERVTIHMISPGRYIAETDFLKWKYSIDIGPRKESMAVAHLSWATASGALIIPGDMLPQGIPSIKLKLELPSLWMTAPRSMFENGLDLADVEKAVFFAGKALRKNTLRSADADVDLYLTGSWHFTDDEASQLTESIFALYADLFGGIPGKKINLVISPFPTSMPSGHWEGSSRGTNVTIVSSDMPFKSQSIQRLHEQLRHEIFHLWIPNAVALTGNYDWFYEGFALYQSLKTGVTLNRIRFDDLLDTISRAYRINSSKPAVSSIISESKDRWSGANTQVYARGMLIAFACDLAMLGSSRGKRSISDVLRKVYKGNRTSLRDGNDAILEVLRSYRELGPLVDGAIAGSEGAIDWPSLLPMAGIELNSRNGLPDINVVTKPSGRQRKVLDRLGYNNWRKLRND